MAVLEVRDINVFYGNAQALYNVYVKINENEVVAVLGINGAGKTTLVGAISGLLHIRAGEIRFQEMRIDHLKSEEIVRLGISHVPQDREIFAGLTVMENLEMGAYIRRDKAGIKKDLEQIFGYFPVLGERKFQRAGTLSGGEQQMLSIARGLLSRPKLVLLDEPSMGLAPIIVKEIFRIINEISKLGISILLVEQNVGMALSVSQYGYILRNGRIIMAESTSKIAADTIFS